MKNLDNKVTSRSKIFVRSDGKIDSISQLKGQKIAFVSPMGAGGYLAPRAYLYSHGVKTKEETKELFTSNLSNTIYGVLLGDMAAGVMCGVNYRLMSEKIDTGELKILGVTGEYPENVIAVRADFDPQLANRFKDVVTAMKKDPAGRTVIKNMRGLKILDFVAYDEGIEQITRDLFKKGRF